MKITKIILSITLALVMTLALCACSFELGGDETWEYKANNKEGSVQLFNDFFEKTFANTNQVVTVKSGDETLYVENIDGTSDYVSYAASSNDTWSFIKEGEYIYAMNGEDTNFYMVGETNYNYGYFVYKSTISIAEKVPDGEGVTFNCESKGSSKDGKGSATFSLEIKNGDAGSIKITASSKDDLVETITFTFVSEGNTSTVTMTIVYGSASVTVPDISGWIKEEY